MALAAIAPVIAHVEIAVAIAVAVDVDVDVDVAILAGGAVAILGSSISSSCTSDSNSW